MKKDLILSLASVLITFGTANVVYNTLLAVGFRNTSETDTLGYVSVFVGAIVAFSSLIAYLEITYKNKTNA